MLTGGKRAHHEGELAEGYYVEPTIFEGHNRMRVFQEEIFGPVVSVTRFKDDEEALAIANDTLYGLGAGVWSRDGTRAYRFGHTELTIDVVPGRGAGFSLEAPEGLRFLTRSRVFLDTESATLAAEGPPSRGG